MSNYKIYCTHHLPLTHRKQYIQDKQVEYNFECEFIETHQPGVDLVVNNTKINNSNLSLNLKHFDIYKNIIENNLDFCFVIEDDLIIDIDLNSFFESIIQERENYDLIFFGGTHNLAVTHPIENKVVYGGYNSTRCTHGYLITNRCAKLLIDNCDFNFQSPIDHTLNFFIGNLNLNCAWTYPHLFQKTVEGHEPSALVR